MGYEKRESRPSCLQCGDRITYGRADKKFCCPECKNKFHNTQTIESKLARQKTVKTLENNYSILESLIRSGITCCTIEDISRLGFTTSLFTSTFRGREGCIYFCFDIGYRMSETRLFRIEKLK